MKYLRVSVLTNVEHGDTTNNGISVTHRRNLIIPHPNGYMTTADIENSEEEYIILELVKRTIGENEYIHFIRKGETKWTMFGGNFASSSDSRFNHYSRYPIPIHDRIES